MIKKVMTYNEFLEDYTRKNVFNFSCTDSNYYAIIWGLKECLDVYKKAQDEIFIVHLGYLYILDRHLMCGITDCVANILADKCTSVMCEHSDFCGLNSYGGKNKFKESVRKLIDSINVVVDKDNSEFPCYTLDNDWCVPCIHHGGYDSYENRVSVAKSLVFRIPVVEDLIGRLVGVELLVNLRLSLMYLDYLIKNSANWGDVKKQCVSLNLDGKLYDDSILTTWELLGVVNKTKKIEKLKNELGKQVLLRIGVVDKLIYSEAQTLNNK